MIGVLSSDDCAFFIHVDAKSSIGEFSGLSGENVFLSKERIPIYWGEFSQVEATMLLIRQALSSSAKYDYFVFLQGSDYPLRSGRYIQSFLEENSGWEFMSMVKMPAPGFPLSKINTLRYPSDKPIRRYASRVLGKLGMAERDYRKSLGALEAYAGDACWVLTRDACQCTMEFVDRNPHFERFFRNTFTSDEMFFHTILGNSRFRLRVRPSVLYRDMPAPGGHPVMINDAHVRFFGEHEKVCVQDQFGSGEALFARKFSDDNLDLVERIDAMIRQREEQGRSRDRSRRLPERPAVAAKPLVSILIPAYNADSWIVDTIRSALGQTWQRKEIIIVNDGSTDKTLAIARRFESSSVRVVTQKNQGAAAARNRAFQLSQGDYIQWLDADDLLAPDKIERQLAALRKDDSRRILLSSAWASFYYRTRHARFHYNSLCEDLSPAEWLLKKMKENLYMQPGTWLASRELVEAAGPWDTRLGFDDDGEYFSRMLLASEGTRFVRETGVFYRVPGRNSLSYLGISNKKRDSLLLSVKLHIQYLRSLEDSERVRKVCLEYLRTKCADVYPERPDIVAELQRVADQLQGRLEMPRLRWKYAWIRPVFGRKAAKWAQVGLPQMKISLARHWDRVMYELEARRGSVSHLIASERVTQED
jgi:glycosyltransferase involved in cell wall biosynthesis